MFVLLDPSAVAGNILRFIPRMTDTTAYPYEGFTGTGRVTLINEGALGTVMGTATWNAGLDTIDIVLDETWPEGEPFVLQPWQQELRGLNGEWCAPKYFTSP